MDPITHTLTGALLGRSWRERELPLAVATGVLAANAPDIDVFSALKGQYAELAFRRGWTHGVLAWVVLPFAVWGLVLAWDRWVRRRRHPGAPPVEPKVLLVLAFAGVLTHPFLDWLNTYGIRLFMPFSGRWFYGDAVFIVDPWIWLIAGGALFLTTENRRELWGWAVFAALAAALLLVVPQVPRSAKIFWLAGLALVIAIRFRRALRPAVDARLGRLAVVRLTRGGGLLYAVYLLTMIAASTSGARDVRRELTRSGWGDLGRVIYSPAPADPVKARYVAETPTGYLRGSFDWLARSGSEAGAPTVVPRLSPDTLPGSAGGKPSVAAVLQAARSTPQARDYLVWARFPLYRIQRDDGGWRVRIGDARYAGRGGAGALSGLVVHLDAQLRPH
ncbi:MAG: metal-dependent hydrolase [Gemmatimonadota bacterium]